MSENPTVPLRHTLATLAYRAAKCIKHAPADFENFRAGPTTRTAVEIVQHMGDLMEWALRHVEGTGEWVHGPPQPWGTEVARFFGTLRKLDDRLKTAKPGSFSPEHIFQGPIADALTHVGQIATLRRLAGAGIRGENYLVAKIAHGQVDMDQPPAVKEFD